MTDTTARKWNMSSLLKSAEKTQTRPRGEVIDMGPRIAVASLDQLAAEIVHAMKMVRVAKDEEAKAQDALQEMETQRLAREQELCELQERMFIEVAKLGVVSGPPPGGEHD